MEEQTRARVIPALEVEQLDLGASVVVEVRQIPFRVSLRLAALAQDGDLEGYTMGLLSEATDLTDAELDALPADMAERLIERVKALNGMDDEALEAAGND
jgi:hypothetical protein